MTRFLRIQFFFCFAVFACTPSGPPFPPANAPKVPDAVTAVVYMIHADIQFYRSSQVSELIFEPCSRESCFRMRFAGVNPSGSIRVRSYEGRAYWKEPVVELRPDRCYEYAKRSFEDRLTPVEGWDCEHLVFQFHTVENPGGPGLLVSRPGETTVHSDWMGTIQAVPLPPAHFAGQILTTQGGRTIVFGANAGKKLKDKQILEALEIEPAPLGKSQIQNRRAGSLEVLERPGDFIITSWKGPQGTANAAILRDAPPAKGIFD